MQRLLCCHVPSVDPQVPLYHAKQVAFRAPYHLDRVHIIHERYYWPLFHNHGNYKEGVDQVPLMSLYKLSILN
jgi:hypothetical protein